MVLCLCMCKHNLLSTCITHKYNECIAKISLHNHMLY